MAAATAPVIPLTPAELDDRRLAVENAIGTMRIEDLEPDETTKQILYRYANGEIELPETNRLLDEYSRTIV
jgi:Antitoxin VbhA